VIYPTETETLYEDENLGDQLRAQRAASIIQQALHPDTVLFTFAANMFKDRTEAYKAIENGIGAAKGFRPISMYGNQQRKELIIEAKFREKGDAQKAIREGFAHLGIQYRGSPSNDGAENKLTKISFSHLPLEDPEDLCSGLQNSLQYYGRVVQIKRSTKDGHFEGDASVILDRTPIKGKEFQELKRMMYLMEWDIHAPASFKGAPPVCFQCRQVGHIKAECPRLASIKCFQCQKRGHTARKCPNREQSFDNEIDSYIQVREKQEKEIQEERNEVTLIEKKKVQEKKIEKKSTTDMVLEKEDQQEDASQEDEVLDKDIDIDIDMENEQEKEEDPTTDWECGVSASIHAPIENATHMKIDSPKEMTTSIVTQKKVDTKKEMLAMTSTKPQRRRLPIAHTTLPGDMKQSARHALTIEEPIIIRMAAKDLPSTTPTSKYYK
jgi:hypothetical protein